MVAGTEFVTAGGRPYPVKEKAAVKRVRLTVGTDYKTGRQLQHEYTGHTAEEIQRKIDASLAMSDSDLQLLSEDKSLEALLQEYLNIKMLSVTAGTINYDRICYRKHIEPYFANYSVKSIRREDILQWQKMLLKKNMSTEHIRHIFSLMNQTMTYACQKGYVNANPCRYARLFHREQKDQSVLSEEQLEHLLIAESGHPNAGFYAVTLLLALRKGEAMGLSWKQIDWETETICINQQGRESRILPYTKTRRVRTLRMPQYAVKILQRQRKLQEMAESMNPNWQNPEGLIFTDKIGRMLTRESIENGFHEIMENCEGSYVTLHSLRRTTASVLAETVSMHAAQYYLGHAAAGTTLQYVYPREKDMRHLVQTMGDYFEKRMEQAAAFRPQDNLHASES